MKDLIEYQVRPITRYVVTRFERRGSAGGSEQKGEFDNEPTAHAVAYALCKAEHERLGWPVDDERIQYPAEQPDREKDAVNIQHALDALAMALPDGFHWPKDLRRAYERAVRSVTRIETRAKCLEAMRAARLESRIELKPVA